MLAAVEVPDVPARAVSRACSALERDLDGVATASAELRGKTEFCRMVSRY